MRDPSTRTVLRMLIPWAIFPLLLTLYTSALAAALIR